MLKGLFISEDNFLLDRIRTGFADKKGYEYLGFIPVLFGPSGKVLEMDLIFRIPKATKEAHDTKEIKQNPAKK